MPSGVMGGHYLDYKIDRKAIARYGLGVGEIQEVIQSAVGGMNITTTIEGVERYPVNLRYSRELRHNLPALRAILVTAPTGQQIPLGQLGPLRLCDGSCRNQKRECQAQCLDLCGYWQCGRRHLREAGSGTSGSKSRDSAGI